MESSANQHTFDKTVSVEAEALKAFEFYAENYEQLSFTRLGTANKQITLGAKPFKCRFCDGQEPERTFKKRAHAVSELLGNKLIKSRYECDDCNQRFSAFEDDLAKMTLPFRNLGGVVGKNGVPIQISASGEAEGKSRMEFKGGTLHVSHPAGDNSFLVDEAARTITFSYTVQPYRPLRAYKAFCKSAFALLPEIELPHFQELKAWLRRSDLTTDQVYLRGSHICYRSFVPAFRAFPEPLAILFRRCTQIDAPYSSMFIAFGNVSYQIFLPCPARDERLRGKTITVLGYPHIYQLQPRSAAGPISYSQIDLSAPERTKSESGSWSWTYEERKKIGD